MNIPDAKLSSLSLVSKYNQLIHIETSPGVYTPLFIKNQNGDFVLNVKSDGSKELDYSYVPPANPPPVTPSPTTPSPTTPVPIINSLFDDTTDTIYVHVQNGAFVLRESLI